MVPIHLQKDGLVVDRVVDPDGEQVVISIWNSFDHSGNSLYAVVVNSHFEYLEILTVNPRCHDDARKLAKLMAVLAASETVDLLIHRPREFYSQKTGVAIRSVVR